MLGAILTAANSSFQKAMAFCLSLYVKKVKMLLAFIFEQPSYKLPFSVSKIKVMIRLCGCLGSAPLLLTCRKIRFLMTMQIISMLNKK